MSQENFNVVNTELVKEPIYRLSKLCCIISEYDGYSISLTAFINSCDEAFEIASKRPAHLLTTHLKNELKGRASHLIN